MRRSLNLRLASERNMERNMDCKIGIIGGSGFDRSDLLRDVRDVYAGTPWGEPSSPLQEGTVDGVPVVLLARHGRGHTLSPSGVNYRANIHALKAAGCTCLLATTAVGSLREEIQRGDLVVIDQFIDFTRRRNNTFHDHFLPGEQGHTAMADPFDATLREILCQGCAALGLRHHPSGTVVTIEGPRFSTRAESRMFRIWGGDIINMSIATEAALANEAGIPYAAVGMSTDYDCWKEDEEAVTWEAILNVFSENVRKVNELLLYAVGSIARKA